MGYKYLYNKDLFKCELQKWTVPRDIYLNRSNYADFETLLEILKLGSFMIHRPFISSSIRTTHDCYEFKGYFPTRIVNHFSQIHFSNTDWSCGYAYSCFKMSKYVF